MGRMGRKKEERKSEKRKEKKNQGEVETDLFISKVDARVLT